MQSVARLPIFHVLFNEAKKSFPLEPRFIHESDFSSGGKSSSARTEIHTRMYVNGNLERVVGPLALRQRRKEIKSILGGGKRVRADSSV